MNLKEYQHKKIAILGYGTEGKSTFNFLLKNGISENQITLLDKTLDENYLQHLADYDIIFKSAGIPYFPEIQAVADKVITQVQFFFDHYQGKVIAITASKGKTTMTSLTYAFLKNAGYNVKVVGNIGKPVLEEIDFDQEYDYVVIELSSYMLQTLKKQNFISLLGAIFPEHLDRHGGMKQYMQAKLRILEGSERNIVFSSTLSAEPLFRFAPYPTARIQSPFSGGSTTGVVGTIPC
ncbi:MAG: hypothetical protein LBD11_06255 [Candidatus Peribacteria bacterium]|nr:hypothetical protein [Candidatus Peribacteria bacterium]